MFLSKVGSRHAVMLCLAMLLPSVGCNKEDAKDAMDSAGDAATQAAETVKEGAENATEGAKEIVEEGKDMASDLSEKAVAYLAPLKDKMGDLESLKDKPEELKTAVTGMITALENKADGLELPEALSGTLDTIKEKLVALKDYLSGEYDQAEVGKKVDDLVQSIKSGLGGGK